MGVSEEYPEETGLIQLFNGMSFISAIGTVLVSFGAWYFQMETVYVVMTMVVSCFYISVFVFNSLGKFWTARFMISIGTPTWTGCCMLLIGGNFSQEVIIVATMAITFVSFYNRWRIRTGLLTAQLVGYLIVYGYTIHTEPILGHIDFLYDDLIAFLGSLGWAIIVLYKFHNDRTQMVQDLKVNNQELKATTEELERFTYIASHDLKSPLRTIISFIGLIERDLKRERYDAIGDRLKFVKSGAEQMNFLVKDILEISKLKNHDSVVFTNIDLNEVAYKAINNLNEEIRLRDAIVRCELLPQLQGIEAEYLVLFQNFIQNGIKYNECEQPLIQISAKETEVDYQLSFRDNGIGIEEEYFEQIFDFFKRLHTSGEYQGTGIGLGLCKKIINQYEGAVQVQSTVGAGTNFTLSFPKTKVGTNLLATAPVAESYA